ncbi:hypothetical protein ACJ6WD_17270 [Streptomyces sp. VTCC 41912]|uniref:hypothetical protein n=1 Tax=Streptomyces sp. VTCC 41912 TaxID=3383243 RepID=UPI003896ABAB
MSHPRKALYTLIHAPVRFSIAAALAAVDEAALRDIAEWEPGQGDGPVPTES